ncbi:MAG: NAD(P)H-hydrate dehydratase [Rhodovarius sp.]|nr:NAD(P)H-hydrate dehydratase [Rhodovarius sp.]
MKAEVLTAAAMRAAEQAAIAAGTPSFTLMQRAAEALARRARAMLPQGGRILVLAGPGNNGGDGLLAAALLRAAGREVAVRLLGAPERLAGDAARAMAAWAGPTDAPVEGAALIIDALFGIGLTRGLGGEAAQLVEAAQATGAPVLAADVPSGLLADTGEAPGAVLPATRTVTFHRLKPGHLLMPGRTLCGVLEVADIGLPDPATDLWRNQPGPWRWPVLPADAHKYARGACLVWSGPALATGASRLAAWAAQRAGAGIVTLAGDRGALAEHAAQVTSLLLRPAALPSDVLADARYRAAVVGPGAGPAARAAALSALGTGRAVVLDADALTATPLPELAAAIQGPCVLTPHEGEFRALFGSLPGSRLERARQAARLAGAVVLLKGPDTVIAAPDGRAAITADAPPWLATAGSGDVLAGIIGGLLAQGMPAWEAACAGAFWHGQAARLAGPGMVAEDLLPALARTGPYAPPA